MLVNLCGRGDKDMETAIDWFGLGTDGRRRSHRRPARARERRTRFDKARAEGRAALVGYLPAGFPDVDGGIEALQAWSTPAAT